MRPLNLTFFFLKLCILDFLCQPPTLKKVEKILKRSGQLQDPNVRPHVLPKGRLSIINSATTMLCSNGLVIRRGISLQLLAQKQDKSENECNNIISL